MQISIQKKGGVIVRNKNIQADILSLISDGKVRTLQTIADQVEVSKITVFRHIQSLSYRYNIETFCGGIERGGVRLITNDEVSVKKLNSNDLQLILSKLESLQDSNIRIQDFIHRLTTIKEQRR